MRDRFRRIYEMLMRVLMFLNENAAIFADIAVINNARAVLQTQADVLSALGVEKVAKTAAAKGSTTARGDARDSLTDAMQDIVDLWETMFEEAGGEAELITMPVNRSDQNIIASAKNMKTSAAEFRGAFIERAMPADFLDDLEGKTNIFEQIVNEAESARRARIGTNAGFQEPARLGKIQVKKIDPIIKRIFRQNPQKLAEWLVASHIERAPQTTEPPDNPQP